MIPKIIHQTWKNNNIPPEWKEAQQSWKTKNPDWEYMYWTDADNLILIKEHYPWFLDTYNSYPHNIQRADAIRPFILYHYGGLYMDMDTICLKNFDNVFKKKGVYIFESAHFGYTNAMMASSRKHPFWKIYIDLMIQNKNKKFYQTHHLYIMQSTGPGALTKCVNSYRKNKLNNDLFIIPKGLFNSCDQCNKDCNINKKMYSYTLNSSSWHQLDSTIINFIYCHRKIIIFISIMIFLLFLINRQYPLKFHKGKKNLKLKNFAKFFVG